MLVSGEPGIGKSRIAVALAERLNVEPHLRLRYFCSPNHQDSALFPFVDQLDRAAGFAREDPPAARLEKLEAVLARAAPPDEDVALLADLLYLPCSEHCPLPNLSAQRKKERTLEALIRQLEGLARQQPVLIIFEDAHWIDPTSRELLDLTVERVRSLPMLLILTFRPEFQPPWIGQSHVTTLALRRLGGREAAALVEWVSGNTGLSRNIVDEIVERADGVPLFLEELTKAVLESDNRVASVLAANGLSNSPIPAALHASLIARLDRLGPIPKEVGQIGAVLGREFGYDLIQQVALRPAAELRVGLDRLTEAGLLFCRGAAP